MKEAIKRWWNKPTTYPSGDTFKRGEIIMCSVGAILALIVLFPASFLLMRWIVDGLMDQSPGQVAGHVVKLGILALL